MSSIWRPYTQEFIAPLPIPIVKTEGAYIYTKEGQRIWDGISSWWLITHGHSHPYIISAIQKQLALFHQVVFSNFTYSLAENMTSLMSEFLPKALSKFFFSDNGSTAVEVAMKMAYQCAQQRGEGHRQKFLAFKYSYHGDTCGAMSASQQGMFTENYKGMLFEVIHCEQGLRESDPLDFWLLDFKNKLNQYANQLCAILIEPLVQGAGGDDFLAK